jgi:hypothetical protein
MMIIGYTVAILSLLGFLCLAYKGSGKGSLTESKAPDD